MPHHLIPSTLWVETSKKWLGIKKTWVKALVKTNQQVIYPHVLLPSRPSCRPPSDIVFILWCRNGAQFWPFKYYHHSHWAQLCFSRILLFSPNWPQQYSLNIHSHWVKLQSNSPKLYWAHGVALCCINNWPLSFHCVSTEIPVFKTFDQFSNWMVEYHSC